MYGKVPLTLDASSMVAKDRVEASNIPLPTCFAKPKSRTFNQPVRSDDDIRCLQISRTIPRSLRGQCAGNLSSISQD